MDHAHLKDRIAWGGNIVARRIGVEANAFRPNGPGNPLELKHRYMRMHAAFAPISGDFAQSSGFGSPLELGHFDTAYTRTGDYLVQGERVMFIGSQDALGPALCVRANRIVSIRRTTAPQATGGSNYGGGTTAPVTVLDGWPVSMLGAGTGGSGLLGLPTETAPAQWTILLPASVPQLLLPADLVIDPSGRQSVVVTAEQGHLGWRLLTRQVTN